MKRPSFLNKGDKIGIVAPARKISPEELAAPISLIESWGFNVVLGKNLFQEHHQFSGNDSLRAEDMQEMLDNPDIKAILSARGGYGSVRIIDRLDFSLFKKNPKWICGYSDLTVFHSHVHTNCKIETLHCTMPISFSKDAGSADSLRKALSGDDVSISFETKHTLSRTGTAEGILIGGNLSILYSLSNTNSDIDTKGKILFLEDLDEYLYHIDRMMMQLKRSGKLKELSGLIIGGMTDMKDNTVPFGSKAEEIIADAVKEYEFPIAFGFPAGHATDNHAIFLGRRASLRVANHISLSY